MVSIEMRVKLKLNKISQLRESIISFNSVSNKWKTWATLLTSNKNGLICTYSGLPGNHPPFSHSLKALQMCKFHLTWIFFLQHITSPLCGFNGDDRRGCTWAQLMLKIQALRFSRRPDTHKKKKGRYHFILLWSLCLDNSH